jgi:hypothetical protein
MGFALRNEYSRAENLREHSPRRCRLLVDIGVLEHVSDRAGVGREEAGSLR